MEQAERSAMQTFGHEETAACNCGNSGCLEQYASATGIVRLAKKALAESVRTVCSEIQRALRRGRTGCL